MATAHNASPSIPETHGAVAIYAKDAPLSLPHDVKPVISWDDEGFALVIDVHQGRLVRAVDVPDFRLIDAPDFDDELPDGEVRNDGWSNIGED